MGGQAKPRLYPRLRQAHLGSSGVRCSQGHGSLVPPRPGTAELDRIEHWAQDADSDPRPHYTDEETGPAGVNGLPQATRGRVWAQEVRLRNFYS